MKRFKLSIALLSSTLMAYSPVLQAASMTPDQKKVINQMLSESTKGTFNDLYQKSGVYLDEPSRGMIEAWLENYGKTKVNPPQAQIIKDQNGKDLIKVVFNQFDQTITMTINPENTKEVDVNGTKVPTQELQSLPVMMSALAEKNNSLAPLAKELKAAHAPKAKKEAVLTIEQFMALSPVERVHYTVLMRQFIEAGGKVLAPQNSQPQASVILNPLWSILPAFAEELRNLGDPCVIAGNLSIYEDGPYWKWEGNAAKKVNGRHCSIAPKESSKFLPPPNVSNLCEPVPYQTGEMIACPAMGYKMNIKKDGGGKMRAYPICQDTARKGFTESGTATCNEASPLPGEENSKERLAAYEEILKGYALLKGGNWEKIQACFTPDHKVKSECMDIFKPHQDAFLAFKEKVMKVCGDTRKMPKDQIDACAEAKKRSLGLAQYIAGTPAPAPSADDPACRAAGGEPKGKVCMCPNGKPAYYGPETEMRYAPCDVPVIEKSTFATPEKDKCKDKENKNSFSCNTGLWAGLAFGAAALWMLWPDSKTPKKPNCAPSGMMIGGPVPAGCPPIIIPPINPNPWPTEGNTGKTAPTGTAGGTRGAQPQSTGTH